LSRKSQVESQRKHLATYRLHLKTFEILDSNAGIPKLRARCAEVDDYRARNELHALSVKKIGDLFALEAKNRVATRDKLI